MEVSLQAVRADTSHSLKEREALHSRLQAAEAAAEEAQKATSQLQTAKHLLSQSEETFADSLKATEEKMAVVADLRKQLSSLKHNSQQGYQELEDGVTEMQKELRHGGLLGVFFVSHMDLLMRACCLKRFSIHAASLCHRSCPEM